MSYLLSAVDLSSTTFFLPGLLSGASHGRIAGTLLPHTPGVIEGPGYPAA